MRDWVTLKFSHLFIFGIISGYKLSDAILDFGRGKYRQALEVFAKVTESGNFTVPYHDGLLRVINLFDVNNGFFNQDD